MDAKSVIYATSALTDVAAQAARAGDDAATLLERLNRQGRASNPGRLKHALGWPDDRLESAIVELVARGLAQRRGQRVSRLDAEAPRSKAMPTPGLSEKARIVLEALPLDGAAIGNIRLRSRVALDNTDYAAAVQELKAAGAIRLGPGRGGTISLASVDTSRRLPKRDLVDDERDLYEPLVSYLEATWVDYSGPFAHAAVTASAANRKRSSGRWSRPDVTAVQVSTYSYLPDITVEVSSYEVKRSIDALKLESIYEAAAHGRWAHRANLVIEDPGEELPDRFIEEVTRFGLGLYIMEKSGSEFKLTEKAEPKPQTPQPEELNNLLSHFFALSDKAKRSAQWHAQFRTAIRK